MKIKFPTKGLLLYIPLNGKTRVYRGKSILGKLFRKEKYVDTFSIAEDMDWWQSLKARYLNG